MGRLLLVCLIAVFVPTIGAARVWHIQPDGAGDVPTIGAGLDSSAVKDTLVLASGTFEGVGNHNLAVPDKALLIKSETGDPADCTIDCAGGQGEETFCFELRAGKTTIDGLTITNANASAFRMLEPTSCTSTPLTVRNCDFVSNTALGTYGPGGAIRVDQFEGYISIGNCRFISNIAVWPGGGAIYIWSVGSYLQVNVDYCTFVDNTSWAWGGAIYCDCHEAVAYIRNSVFYGNSAEWRGTIAVDCMAARVEQCTFLANSGVECSGIYGGVTLHIGNCIVAYGVGGCGIEYYTEYGYPGEVSVACTDVYGNEGGDWGADAALVAGLNGNFSACPSFCQYELEPYDLHLCSASPCLPGNHPSGADCHLIGALGQGCVCGPSRVEPSTWGRIKAQFRD